MAVKIRMKRVGAKKRPTYRIVVADSRSPRDGRYIEVIGHYNPMVTPHQLVVKRDRFDAWVAQGALPTPTVKKLLNRLIRAEAKGAN